MTDAPLLTEVDETQDAESAPDLLDVTLGDLVLQVRRPTQGQLAVAYRAARNAMRDHWQGAEAVTTVLDVIETMIVNEDDRMTVIDKVARAEIDLDDLIIILEAFRSPQEEQAPEPVARRER